MRLDRANWGVGAVIERRPASPRGRRSTAIRAVAWTVAVAIAACGPAVERGTDLKLIDPLLRRTPDLTIENHGRVTPPLLGEADLAWGTGTGWIPDEIDHAQLVAYPRGLIARLELVADEPADRTLGLHLVSPIGTQRSPEQVSDEVVVRLNGRELSRIEVGAVLARYEVDAPAALWQAGTNILELQPERTRRIRADSKFNKPVGIGVAAVDYGEARRIRIDRDAGRAWLAPETGTVHFIEGSGRRELIIEGRSESAGELLLRFGTLDPATGNADSEALGTRVIEAADDGLVSASVAIPEVDSESVLTIQARWYPEESADLALERLDVASETPTDRPSLLFISIDTLSARHMSAYGYPRATSPSIEALASEGVLFERAIANAPWTAQSYMSQFTGLHPGAHERGHGKPSVSIWEKYDLAPNRWTIAEALRAAGYETAAWVDNPWIEPSLGLDQGFEHFDRSTAEIPLWDTGGGIDAVVDNFERWLDGRADDRPFFALLQALDVHGPYVVAPQYEELFAEDDLYDDARSEPVGHGQLQSFRLIPEHIARAEQRSGELPPRMPLRPFVDAYDQKIRHVDDAVGRLVASLKRRGIYEDLTIIISADHGESLLEHDFYFAHANLFDETLHVPLIIRLPDGVHGGQRISTAVQLIDLYPTICELTGLPAREFLRGRSLAEAWRTGSLDPVPIWSEGGMGVQYAVEYDGRKLLFSDYSRASPQTKLRHRRLPADWTARIAPELVDSMWTNAEYKGWLNEHPEVAALLDRELGPHVQVFDLRSDPLESTNLAGADPERDAELVALAMELIDQIGQDRGRASSLATVEDLDDAQRRQLEELGYLESSD